MKIIFLPIEPLSERYTAQMLRWVESALEELGVEYITVLPKKSYDKIENGQWLDTYGTIRFRNEQINILTKLLSEGEISNGDIFLFGDIWYTGIEAIRFMADLSGLDIKIGGWHHAGCFDPADLLHKKLKPWGYSWELWLLNDYVDFLCVGSEFHTDFLHEAGVDTDGKVLWKGQAWQPSEVVNSVVGIEKENIILFSNRYAEEKNPQAFFELCSKYGDGEWRFVFSTSNELVYKEVSELNIKNLEIVLNRSKADYYELVAKSKIFYSSAYQETFGYSMHEAIALGLCLVVPDRCSYSETLDMDARWVYRTAQDPIGERALLSAMEDPIPTPYYYTQRHEGNEKMFVKAVIRKFGGSHE